MPDTKPKRDGFLRTLIGRRTPRPEEGKAPGPNWDKKEKPAAKKPEPKRENFLNPREVMARREKEAGLKRGGMVKAKKGKR